MLKGDVSGSVEAVEDEIAKLPQDEVSVNIIHRGVGGINESDVMLAAASDAVILAFNVRPVGDARALAEREGIEIRSYSVDLPRDRRAARGDAGHARARGGRGDASAQAEVRQTFRASRIGTIAGCFVTEGQVTRGAKVRVVRDAHRHQRDDDREPAALQRGRARGRGRLRVRHRARQLPGRQGRRRARGLRDAQGRARARLSRDARRVAGYDGCERMRRVDEAIRQVLADALAGELADPRLGFVTVTDVRDKPGPAQRARVRERARRRGGARGLAGGAAQRPRPAAAPHRRAAAPAAHADARVRLRPDDRPRAARRGAAAGGSR